NNLEVVTATTEKYETSFGFTEQEVFAALNEYDLAEKKQDVKMWYDGFIFGNQRDIYNPWSIINYLDKQKLTTYWANTSSNSLIDKLIREGSAEIKADFEILMDGGKLEKQIEEQIVFQQLSENEEAVWSLLLASGYLKAESSRMNELGENRYLLSLTNTEVRVMFRGMIRSWFAKAQSGYNAFVKAFLKNDLKAMNAYMNRVALATFSYFDTGKKPSDYTEPERFYHGFLLGLMVELADRYVITSNRESGFGRYDVMIEPKNIQDDAMILEFKVRDAGDEENLHATIENALKQIEEENYEACLTAKGIPKERIRKYGFAFEGKRVLIGSNDGSGRPGMKEN
ncbi:MAG: PD-(D/E)XK nuclease domain-containing protein, partial [Lachnospiraceae bacterium]|nr:PD-(D/E)XK nuclease domain-containing protein [Lachnospiraceae bacterium]